jgi:hypothetical protein
MSTSSTLEEFGANVQSKRRRVVWTTKKSFHPSSLDAELEEFGPLTKCETKCEKTYYRCPMRKSFGCGMVVCTIREVMTGYVAIETSGSSHSHSATDEQFDRGLSNAVKESIDDITKFNHRIRPKALQRSLITVPFNFPTYTVEITKVASYLKRVRRAMKSSYVEHTVSGLWNAVSSRQFDEASSDWAKYFCAITADTAISETGSSDARVQILRRQGRCWRAFATFLTHRVLCKLCWIPSIEF